MDDLAIDQEPPKYWPAFILGIGASALFLELFGQSASLGLVPFLVVEGLFFLAAALASFEFAPRHPFAAAAACVPGVLVGVLVNVFFHPMTAAGFERNIFPIEALAHTFFAAPIMFIAALVKYYWSPRWRNKSNSNGPGA